ncbi:hypothetical protein YDYSG_36620 [Paenibacillus tyrfis]|uniref:hypothetical protein n=1 Tax=Paenibacillus tyrfis TaxID=1501230 RepID=UPI002492CD56|nr:hypothetical protein [Paenibacillus tyrfis]GLI07632.1 hypothetical protein YDYSG_36620 [Paenibacillus tyrfis]
MPKIEKIRPSTPEVKAIHETYVSASNKQFNGLTQIQGALENNDTKLAAEANAKLAEARKEMRDYQDKVKEMANKFSVKLN